MKKQLRTARDLLLEADDMMAPRKKLGHLAVSLATAQIIDYISASANQSVDADAGKMRLIRELLRLAKTRDGAAFELGNCIARNENLDCAVVALRKLPPWPSAQARARERLRVVVDNTR
jgi:hypothetical protein